MSRSDDSRKTAKDVRLATAGPGLPFNWRCMGCNQNRGMTGRRGAGVKQRCAECVAKRLAS